jgi:hypothetical protein
MTAIWKSSEFTLPAISRRSEFFSIAAIQPGSFSIAAIGYAIKVNCVGAGELSRFAGSSGAPSLVDNQRVAMPNKPSVGVVR